MMVGGGIVPETNFTRHDVHRPRPPHVAVMSTPPSWAARRMVEPGSTESTTRSGRMVRGMPMRASGYHRAQYSGADPGLEMARNAAPRTAVTSDGCARSPVRFL